MSRQQGSRTKLFVDAMPLATPRISGIGHITYGLVRGMLDDPDFMAKYEVVLVAASRGLKYVRDWKLEGVTYVGVPLPSRVWNRLSSVPFLPPFDLYFGQGIYLFPNFRTWPLLRSKALTVIHDLVFLLHPDVVEPRNRQFLVANIQRWVKRSNLIVTASDSSKSEIRDRLRVPEGNIRLVRWGVDTSLFNPRPEAEIEAVRQRYGLPKDYVLYLGNIEPRKNLVRLIQAYSALPSQIKQAHPLLLVGGGGWLAEEIDQAQAAAIASGDQIMRPNSYVEETDLPALYSGASILAWPAIYEGYGMPPLQAMACGTPCVLSSASSVPEIGGKAAIYADPESVSDISDKIKTLLEDKELRTSLSRLGLEQAKTLSWPQTIRQLRSVLDELTA